jgi:hypothetical protein
MEVLGMLMWWVFWCVETWREESWVRVSRAIVWIGRRVKGVTINYNLNRFSEGRKDELKEIFLSSLNQQIVMG